MIPTDLFAQKLLFWFSAILLSVMMTSCATVATDPRDPWEGFNRDMQSFNDTLDDYAMKPVAKGYQWLMPDFVDQGISNFFSNIRDIRVTINDVLQWKLKQSGIDLGRFLINTTAGVAGFVDVATMIDMPKHDEDFGQTLGYWGVPTGPYLVLPFFGPSSIRGAAGLAGDAAMNPLSYTGLLSASAATWASFGAYTVDVIDRRADALEFESIASEAAVDRYEFFRDSYLQHRRYLVNDGKIEEEQELDLDEEDLLDEDNAQHPEQPAGSP